MSWSETSHFLNSVLWIRHDLASILFNCGHFSALRSSSHVSVPFNFSHNSSQFVSTIFSSARIFSTHFNSYQSVSAQLFWPLPTSSQIFSPLLTTSHCLSTMLTSAHIFSTLPNSAKKIPPLLNSFQLPIVSTLFRCLINPCGLFNVRFLIFWQLQSTNFIFLNFVYLVSTIGNSLDIFSIRNLELQNTVNQLAAATGTAAPTPDLGAKTQKERLWNNCLEQC